jgi:hypothetical protein
VSDLKKALLLFEKGLTGDAKPVIRAAVSEINDMDRPNISRTSWWWQRFIGGVCPLSV